MKKVIRLGMILSLVMALMLGVVGTSGDVIAKKSKTSISKEKLKNKKKPIIAAPKGFYCDEDTTDETLDFTPVFKKNTRDKNVYTEIQWSQEPDFETATTSICKSNWDTFQVSDVGTWYIRIRNCKRVKQGKYRYVICSKWVTTEVEFEDENNDYTDDDDSDDDVDFDDGWDEDDE